MGWAVRAVTPPLGPPGSGGSGGAVPLHAEPAEDLDVGDLLAAGDHRSIVEPPCAPVPGAGGAAETTPGCLDTAEEDGDVVLLLSFILLVVSFVVRAALSFLSIATSTASLLGCWTLGVLGVCQAGSSRGRALSLREWCRRGRSSPRTSRALWTYWVFEEDGTNTVD